MARWRFFILLIVFSIYDYYQLVANHLRQLTVLKAGLDYLQKNFVDPELQKHEKLYEIINYVRELKRTVVFTTNRIVYVCFLSIFNSVFFLICFSCQQLQKFNPPKPVYHIDSKYLLQLKKGRFTFATFSKYSAYLGIGALIIYGIRKRLVK